MKNIGPGPIILLGSGETSPTGRKLFERLLRKMPESPKIALLETPAGFEVNSERVIGKVAEFINQSLQNYKPQVSIVPARKKGTFYSPDNPDILGPLLEADVIFMGAGSPTYAVRQLRDSSAWNYVLARHRLGAALVLTSAAVTAMGIYTLPVYEIFKVGEDLHWKPGLDFFGTFGGRLVIIPHWNNKDGGADLDTSRCFMGEARFQRLIKLLPGGIGILGLDEKTCLWMDPVRSICRVMGQGNITILHTGHKHPTERELAVSAELMASIQQEKHVHQYKNSEVFPLQECFPISVPEGGTGLPEEVWEEVLNVQNQEQGEFPPAEVLLLVDQREAARERNDWTVSDELRERISALGWLVSDTPDGPKLEKRS